MHNHGCQSFFLFSIQGYGSIQCHPIHPSTEFGLSPKFWISLPQLNCDFLEQVIVGVTVIGIQGTHFMNNVLIVLQLRNKFMFQFGIHSWLVVLKKLVSVLFGLLQKRQIKIKKRPSKASNPDEYTFQGNPYERGDT